MRHYGERKKGGEREKEGGGRRETPRRKEYQVHVVKKRLRRSSSTILFGSQSASEIHPANPFQILTYKIVDKMRAGLSMFGTVT